MVLLRNFGGTSSARITRGLHGPSSPKRNDGPPNSPIFEGPRYLLKGPRQRSQLYVLIFVTNQRPVLPAEQLFDVLSVLINLHIRFKK
jgi:hypothetical protein